LGAYWTGVPARPLSTLPGLRALTTPLEKHDLLPLPDDQVRHQLVPSIGWKMATTLFPSPLADDLCYRLLDWFDRWCASRLNPDQFDAVIAYENSAAETFRRAHKLGMTTILDAASFHHAWQDQFYEYTESDRVHQRVNRQKDLEVERADHILTVSEMARKSYLDAGVAPERVTAVPVGCDLSRFGGDELLSPTDRFTFIFAGHASQRKGADTLLQASQTLREEDVAHDLWFVGGADDDVPWHLAPHVKRYGRVPQTELATLFRQVDCLVLPSRHDSFGMVVVEALASGLPVIVSDQVGAKEAVGDASGWILPAEDSDAFAQRMAWCVENPSAVTSMAPAARRAAEHYSWGAYHQRVVEVLSQFLPAPQAAS
jgi:glycosyltransferase involved in cell wall biosynthesis